MEEERIKSASSGDTSGTRERLLRNLHLWDKGLRLPPKLVAQPTKGFDAWQCPENITEMGLIKTLLVSKEESPDEYEKFNQLSQFALDQYNDQQGTNFQFVKVLKANVEFSGSCIYYLTFQAEDTASGAFENFQARVILRYTVERKVDLLSLEPKKSQPVEESGKGTVVDPISPSETLKANTLAFLQLMCH